MWLFDLKILNSEKNELIIARRLFGSWKVTVNGCEQTGPYVHRMWRNAFKRVRAIPRKNRIKSALMLGLGAGGEIRNIHEHFPACDLTVVEYDEAMVTLARRLRLHRPYPFPTVELGDAKIVIPKLEKKYDLIIVDMFHGFETSPLVGNIEFLKSIQEKLSDDGTLLVNVYRKKSLVKTIASVFGLLDEWIFEYNTLAVFAKTKKIGQLSAPPPPGYVPPHIWPEFHVAQTVPMWMEPISNEKGVSLRVGPVSIETYTADKEPDTLAYVPYKNVWLRIIQWQRYSASDYNPRWKAYSTLPSLKTGYAEIKPGISYWTEWSETERRYRRRWLEKFQGERYVIEKIPAQEFKDSYSHGTLGSGTRSFTWKAMIAPRVKHRPDSVTFWGARQVEGGDIHAGIAVIDSVKNSGSYYLAGFYRKESATDPLMTGLFDKWFSDSENRGIRFINFGNFWKKGDPKSWKGFSEFKSKFGVNYIQFQPILYKFIVNGK